MCPYCFAVDVLHAGAKNPGHSAGALVDIVVRDRFAEVFLVVDYPDLPPYYAIGVGPPSVKIDVIEFCRKGR
jgi:hypothetical protein